MSTKFKRNYCNSHCIHENRSPQILSNSDQKIPYRLFIIILDYHNMFSGFLKAIYVTHIIRRQLGNSTIRINQPGFYFRFMIDDLIVMLFNSFNTLCRAVASF